MFNLADYETVEDRLIKFWKEYPDGRIETELLELHGNGFIVKARIYRTEADLKVWTTGLAHEQVTDKGVNSTSALENCETSAIGRALANAGYATTGKRPSREEMAKVVNAPSTPQISQIVGQIEPWEGLGLSNVQPLSAAVAVVNNSMAKAEVQGENCRHGAMIEKSGTSANTGKAYLGFVCSVKGGCEAIWYRKDPMTGEWRK